MKAYEAVAQRILDLCAERNITVNAIANISGLPSSTVKSIIYGISKNPGIATIKALCDGFEISLNDFFNDEVFDELDQEIE